MGGKNLGIGIGINAWQCIGVDLFSTLGGPRKFGGVVQSHGVKILGGSADEVSITLPEILGGSKRPFQNIGGSDPPLASPGSTPMLGIDKFFMNV